MDAEIHNAPTTRKSGIVKPGFIRAVGIMEDKVSCVDGAESSSLDELSNATRSFEIPKGQNDAQQAVDLTSGVNYLRGFCCGAAQRFLTEHCQAGLQCDECLACVQCTRCCYDDAIEFFIDKLIVGVDEHARGHRLRRSGMFHLCIAHGRDLDRAT